MTIHDDLREVMGLLPCPFCGGHAVVDISSGSDERNGYNFSVAIVCVPCLAKLTRASGYDKNGWCNESVASVTARVITAWNTRPALLARQEEDAERYRWLRSKNFGFAHDEANRGITTMRWGDWPYDTDEGHAAVMDAAIDAARSGGGG